MEIAGSTLALARQTTGDDTDRRAQGATGWRRALRRLRRAGFTAVDLVDGWLPFSELEPAELDELGSVLDELGMTACGVSVTRCSLIDAQRGEENLERTLRAVETTARLGVPVLEIGFHPRLDERSDGVWFWETPYEPDDRSEQTWALAVERVGTVCAAAAGRGVAVNVELYEDTLVCTGADAARLVTSVGVDNLGVNPDLGNLYRSWTPQREPWLTTLRGCLPHLTYWHLKNYTRSSAARGGPFAVSPTDLGGGDIDYRLAVGEVLASGYRGPLVVEQYGGDALWQQERGRVYLERLVDDWFLEQDGQR